MEKTAVALRHAATFTNFLELNEVVLSMLSGLFSLGVLWRPLAAEKRHFGLLSASVDSCSTIWELSEKVSAW